MKELFLDVARTLDALTREDEVYLCRFSGEQSDFVRINAARVRQAGSVRQHTVSVDLICGRRHAAASVELSGDASADRERISTLITQLRARRSAIGEDPYLNYATTVSSGETVRAGNLPDGTEAVQSILEAAQGLDLVGIWASGTIHTGFANSFGQRNWSGVECFNFDWSCHGSGDAAVKASCAGFEWDPDALTARIRASGDELSLIERAPVVLAPGAYRAWLAPAAVAELLGMLGWGGFDLASHRTRQTPLLRLADGQASLDARVRIAERSRGSASPEFTREGFIKPDEVVLIDGGRHAGCLTGARAAMEYDEPVSADGGYPRALVMDAGALSGERIHAAVGDGLCITNLWYLNYSDRNAARITGMTRFACTRIENGEVIGPIAPMRFDESLYRMLGEHLIDLGAERELIMDPGTYGQRSSDSLLVPGILVDGFTLTL